MFISNNIYKTIIEYAIIPTVDIIFINSNNEILLWLRNNAPLQWAYYLPWWRIHKWEKIIDAAVRKSQEELWINIIKNKLQFIWVYNDIFEDSAFEWLSTHCIPCTFLYKIDNIEIANIKHDEQHAELKFFHYQDKTLIHFLTNRLEEINNSYNIF